MQFYKNTRSSRYGLLGLLLKIGSVIIIFMIIIFLLNKINFPAPIKEIREIISNENFKIVK